MDIKNSRLAGYLSGLIPAWLNRRGRQAREAAAEPHPVAELVESKELPDPFQRISGGRVTGPDEWRERREEIKHLLSFYEYGRMPPAPGNVTVDEEVTTEAFGGQAVEKTVRLLMGPDRRLSLTLTITSPAGGGPFPAIVINRRASPRSYLLTENLEAAVRRGYLVAEYAANDLQPDETAKLGPAKLAYPNYDWGTIAVWAWGGMRVIDHLLTRPEVDPDRLIVTGHSRHGKTALLTGALDDRVKLTVPNASGGGGFQCWRFPIQPDDPPGIRRHESVAVMNRWRSYWLQPRLGQFSRRVDLLPFDQHFLAALVAPRALCAVESLEDDCATPICVQRTYQAVREVYDWLEAGEKLGIYFRRKGGHGQGPEDWAALLDFADRVFAVRTPGSGRRFDRLPYPEVGPGFSWRAPEGMPAAAGSAILSMTSPEISLEGKDILNR